MSVFDEQPSGERGGCFGFCVPPENSKYNFQKQHQFNHEGLTGEVQRKTKEVDTMLSNAFNELTFEERERQQEVLHGVDDQIAEETTFIEASLRELDAHIERKKRGSAYETAEQMDPVYVQPKAFRVMFLRSNDYDAKAAAGQMLMFFEQKRKLFGVDKLVQEITVDDLDEHDRASLNTGWLQFNGKDRSGRLVFVQLSGLRAFKELKNELRGKFYLMMQLLKQQENQLKGIVHVIYSMEEFRDCKSGAGYFENVQLSLAIPIKTAAIHHCCSDPGEYAFNSLSVNIIPAKIAARIRIHLGSHLECQYRLCSFGITKFTPKTNGVIHVPPLGEKVFRSGISQPTANDVLSTGSKTNNNPGNHHLRTLVVEWWQLYDSGSNETKRAIIDGIIEKIKTNGGRFLKQDDTGEVEPSWIESPLDEVRIKVAQMFRNQKRASKRASNRQSIVGTPISGAPLPFDVVFGKAQNTRGKELMQCLIRERSQEYDALDRGMKRSVASAVMETIKGKGGRFLQPGQDDGVFLEVPDDKARERISKYFRNHRRTQKR